MSRAMPCAPPINRATEPSAPGEPWLVRRLRPVPVRERRDHLSGQPMAPRKPHMPRGIARAQSPCSAREAGLSRRGLTQKIEPVLN
jgi:hypothetical protein